MSEATKRDACQKELRYKNTGPDEETIGIRLEKQRILPDLAKRGSQKYCFAATNRCNQKSATPRLLFYKSTTHSTAYLRNKVLAANKKIQ